MGFQSITNSITTYLQDICDINNFVIRFDNDLRSTPTDSLWFECKINFENSEQKELGINSYRNPGNVIIKIKNELGLGLADLLAKADIIITAFRTINIGSIIFRVPSIKNNGRIEDNWEVEITCPFYVDEN